MMRAHRIPSLVWPSLKPILTSRLQTRHLASGHLDHCHAVNIRDLFELRGKVALITGGARGLGLAFAEALAEYGADIAVLDIREPDADFDEISKKHGVRTSFAQADIMDAAAVDEAVRQVASSHGRIDICVASAGIAIEAPFLDTTPGQLRKLLAVNAEGLYYTNQSVVRQMVAQRTGGSIVNISSIAGVKHLRSQPHTTAYAATKGAVIAHTRALAGELAPHGIRVNSIAPGFIYTDMTKGFVEERQALLKLWQDETMLGDIGASHELKGGIVFLCSDASSFVTGQNISIDGGISSK